MNQENRANAHAWALSAASVAAVLYLACAAIVALWPAAALRLLAWVTHIANVEKFAGDVVITPLSLAAGLIEIVAYVYVGVWLLIWFHAQLSRR